jgi:hypothetical protein
LGSKKFQVCTFFVCSQIACDRSQSAYNRMQALFPLEKTRRYIPLAETLFRQCAVSTHEANDTKPYRPEWYIFRAFFWDIFKQKLQ